MNKRIRFKTTFRKTTRQSNDRINRTKVYEKSFLYCQDIYTDGVTNPEEKKRKEKTRGQ